MGADCGKLLPENDILTFLKIRASYGEVGNDQLGGNRRFYYLPNTYNLDQGGYSFGNSDGSSPNPYWTGATEGTLGNPDITWERAKKYDVGIEAPYLPRSPLAGGRLVPRRPPQQNWAIRSI